MFLASVSLASGSLSGPVQQPVSQPAQPFPLAVGATVFSASALAVSGTSARRQSCVEAVVPGSVAGVVSGVNFTQTNVPVRTITL